MPAPEFGLYRVSPTMKPQLRKPAPEVAGALGVGEVARYAAVSTSTAKNGASQVTGRASGGVASPIEKVSATTPL